VESPWRFDSTRAKQADCGDASIGGYGIKSAIAREKTAISVT